jgi:hypothetical protein
VAKAIPPWRATQSQSVANDDQMLHVDPYSESVCANDDQWNDDQMLQAQQDQLWHDSPDDDAVASRLRASHANSQADACADPDQVEKAFAFWDAYKQQNADATAEQLPQFAAAVREMRNAGERSSCTPYANKPQRPTQQQQLESRKKQQQEQQYLMVQDLLCMQHSTSKHMANMAGAVNFLAKRTMETENALAHWGYHPFGGQYGTPDDLHRHISQPVIQVEEQSKLLASHALAARTRMQNMCSAKTAATPETPQTPQETPKP